MKAKKYLSALFMMGLILTLIPLTGCSKDDDDDKGSSGMPVLTVNGKTWEATTYPVYEQDWFYFYCTSTDGVGHTLFFQEDLSDEDLEKGDDVSPAYIIFVSENAKYVYEGGEVTVTNCSSDAVTLKFDNYKVRYAGKSESILEDGRGNDIVGEEYLTFNGTVTFHNMNS